MKNKKLLVSEKWKIDFVERDDDIKIESPNDVIVKTHFSHISAGTEMACVSGIEDWFQIPDTPGYTSIAEVIEKGDNVTHVDVGDLVFTYGQHAQYSKLEYGERWHGVCVKLPSGVNEEHAAFTHMAGIAMTSLRKSNIELGDYVAVVGLGAIGNLAAQLAALQGATVIATDIDDHRVELAQKAGLSHAINSAKMDAKEYIMDLTNNEGVSTLIDASGMSPVIAKSLDYLAYDSEVILLGTPRAPYETNVTEMLQHFHLLPHCANMKGALEFTYPTHKEDFTKHSIERNASIIMNLIKEGKLKIDPLYSHKLHPSEAQSAYEGLRDKKDEYIGVVFDWNLV